MEDKMMEMLVEAVINDFEAETIDAPTLRDVVYNFKTGSKYGFTHLETRELLDQFPDVDRDKYWKSLYGSTCMKINGQTVTYHCDVLRGIHLASKKD